ncbi:methyltransferase type 11 [Caballeronia fortuita]|uniref:Methyltransferase type 11 n=1 Tax=Caballeronia fortuita TaxID=1777138 RepID=A0A158A1U2_9BURK|nr:class I SAM-dependent methyltransferase [Caballeronia fortuita]SAK51713.1 methyltransferase type 11 [Caballeronia fortuita]
MVSGDSSRARFDAYWSENDRSTARAHADGVAKDIVRAFGIGRVLDAGCGNGRIVGELLQAGADAYGVDVSPVAVESANRKYPSRFQAASLLALPYVDGAFDTVVAARTLEYFPATDIAQALKEIHRASRRYVFLQIGTAADANDAWVLTNESRAWWEQRCFEAGFRKHPAHYQLHGYERLNDEQSPILLLLEKVPQAALARYPFATLAESDALRETGARADGEVVRYKWASDYIRQGDTVLDARCGAGCGTYYLGQLTKVAAITAIDASQHAIDYANANFASLDRKLTFRAGVLSQCLPTFADGRFDTILCFDALEHAENPRALLDECHRLLSPGGRVVAGVPASAYTLDALKAQFSDRFMIEAIFEQNGGGSHGDAPESSQHEGRRALRPIALDDASPEAGEWWLIVGMKHPAQGAVPYRESVYGYSSPPAHLLQFERDYDNPWLVRSMLEFQFRAKDQSVLTKIAADTLEAKAGRACPDAAAALAVLGYRLQSNPDASARDIEAFIAQIDPHITDEAQQGHRLRWRVSLSFLAAALYRKIGKLDAALTLFRQVATTSIDGFSPSLGTKVVDAAFDAGMLHAGRGEIAEARELWKLGVTRAYALLATPMTAHVGDIEEPHEFTSIVAVEYLDSAVRCIKALRWTAQGRERPLAPLPTIANENWKSMLAERADTIGSMERVLTDRWDLIRSVEQAVQARDEVITSQSKLLDERWMIMQSMEKAVRARDEAIASQATLLDERWDIMQSMGREIQARDELIAQQNKLRKGRWGVMRSMWHVLHAGDQAHAAHDDSSKEDSTVMKFQVQDAASVITNQEGVIAAYKEALRAVAGKQGDDEIVNKLFAAGPRNAPFEGMALTMYLFTRRLYETALNDGVTELFFFAREGELLKRMFDLLQSCNGGTGIRTHYLKVSRRSTFLLSLRPLHEEKFDVLFRQYRRISIIEFLKSQALEEYAPAFAADLDVSVEDFARRSQDLPHDPLFARLMALPAFARVYEAERVSRSSAFAKYVGGFVGGGVPERMSVVDVGWKGSIQDNLFGWLRNVHGERAHVKGYYVGLVASGNAGPANEKSGLLLSNVDTLTPGYYVFNENRSLFEVLLHANHGSAQRYVETGDGEVAVVEDEFVEGPMIEAHIKPVAEHIWTKFRQLATVMSTIDIADQQLLTLAVREHARMVFSPSAAEIDWMYSLSHVENFGVFEESTFGSSPSHKSLTARLRFTINLVKRRRPSELGFWPWLTVKERAVQGLSAAYRAVRLWQNRRTYRPGL